MTLSNSGKVGPYVISGLIGSGGMGQVYRARDTRLDRDVALKSINASLAGDSTQIARFEREAKVLASLSHPNIAAVYGLESHQDSSYLIMELVSGETLAERLKRGPLPLGEALTVCARIAAGVEAAHDAQVIHRDLKPANIILTPDDQAKVLDFGLARRVEPAHDQSKGGSSATMALSPVTQVGLAMGTPGYMSPEQARGKELDRRTDIFSFGCLLYECLTGKRAFGGESVADAVASVIERDPDYAALPAATPPRVRELLQRCFEKDPKRRLRDIGDARLELEQAFERKEWTSSGRMRAVADRRTAAASRWIWLTAATAAVIAGAVAIGFAFGRRQPPVTEITAAAVTYPTRLILCDSGAPQKAPNFDTETLAISRDGRFAVYTQRTPEQKGSKARRVRDLSDLGSRPIGSRELPTESHSAFFSPDARWVAYIEAGVRLVKEPVAGGPSVDLIELPGLLKGAVWTESHGIILSPSPSSGLSTLDPDSGELVPLTTPDRARGELSHRWPDVLPGERFVLFTVKTADLLSFDEAEIALLDLETKEWKPLIRGGAYARYASTGHIVYARNGQILAVPFDIEAQRVTGASVVVLDGVITDPNSGIAQFALARDAGMLIYIEGQALAVEKELGWFDRTGRYTPIGVPHRNYYQIALSPDGNRLAASIYGATDSLFVVDLERNSLTRVTTEGNCSAPAWTPDGNRVTFASDLAGAMSVYMKNADGSGVAEVIPLPPAVSSLGGDPSLVFMASGKLIDIDKRRFWLSSGKDIWLVPLDDPATESPLVGTRFREGLPAVSPDGHWLAYTSEETGRAEVYVSPFPDVSRRWIVSEKGGSWANWNRTGTELYYMEGDSEDQTSAVWALEVKGGSAFTVVKSTKLFEFSRALHESDSGLVAHPDGQKFFTNKVLTVERNRATDVLAILNWYTELSAKFQHPEAR